MKRTPEENSWFGSVRLGSDYFGLVRNGSEKGMGSHNGRGGRKGGYGLTRFPFS
jgi:hypothetical protein